MSNTLSMVGDERHWYLLPRHPHQLYVQHMSNTPIDGRDAGCYHHHVILLAKNNIYVISTFCNSKTRSVLDSCRYGSRQGEYSGWISPSPRN